MKMLALALSSALIIVIIQSLLIWSEKMLHFSVRKFNTSSFPFIFVTFTRSGSLGDSWPHSFEYHVCADNDLDPQSMPFDWAVAAFLILNTSSPTVGFNHI